MQPDDARHADTSAWLAKAQLDLRSAEHALAAAPPLHEDVLFHCQQTVEKAMKAWLTFHDVPFRRTHSLEELGRQCVAVDSRLQRLVDQAAPLTEYAWRFRYPGEAEPPGREETEEALHTARTALAVLLECLPPPTHPHSG